MKMTRAGVDETPAEDKGEQEKNTGEQGEGGRDRVHDEPDAEHHRPAREPVPEPVDERVGGGCLQKHKAEEDVEGGDGDGEGVRGTAGEPGPKCREKRSAQQRKGDGQRRQHLRMVHREHEGPGPWLLPHGAEVVRGDAAGFFVGFDDHGEKKGDDHGFDNDVGEHEGLNDGVDGTLAG